MKNKLLQKKLAITKLNSFSDEIMKEFLNNIIN